MGTAAGQGAVPATPRRSVVVRLSIAVFVVVGAAARLWGMEGRSLWFDEAFSWRLSSFPLDELFQRAARDHNPPLYYVLLKGWAAACGESPLALRSLSVVAAFLAIGGVWLFCREAFDSPFLRGLKRGSDDRNESASASRQPSVGALAAAFLSINVLHIAWANQARMYALGTALAAFSSWALIRALRRGGYRAWMMYAGLALAFAYTHTYAALTIASQFAFAAGWFLISLISGRSGRPSSPRGSVKPAAFAFALLAVGFAPWLPTLLRQRAQVQDSFWTEDVSLRLIGNTCHAVWLRPFNHGGGSTIVGFVAAILTGLLLASLLWRPRAGEWLTFWLAAGPLGIAIVVSVVDTRIFAAHYLIFCHTFMLVALARLIDRRFYGEARHLVTATMLVAMAAIAAEWLAELRIPERPGARAAAEFVEAGRPGQPVVVSSPPIYLPVLYHLRDRGSCRLYDDGVSPRLNFSGAAVIGPWELLDRDEIARLEVGRVWVVNFHAGNWGAHIVPVPSQWRVVQLRRFPEVYYAMQGEIVVVEYETLPR